MSLEIHEDKEWEGLPEFGMLENWVPCKCGLVAQLEKSKVKTWTASDGSNMWKLRFVFKCKTCGASMVYRLSGYEFDNGKIVKAKEKAEKKGIKKDEKSC